MTDAFAHALRLDQIHDGDRLDLSANEEERRSVARRLGLASLRCFEAHVALSVEGRTTIRAQGRLQAAVDQSCVVTGEPVPAHVDEAFELLFVPEPQSENPDEEIELGAADCDITFHDGAQIDLGSALADTLALSLDPYPRSAGADAAMREAGIITEEQASPFAALARLKRTESDET